MLSSNRVKQHVIAMTNESGTTFNVPRSLSLAHWFRVVTTHTAIWIVDTHSLTDIYICGSLIIVITSWFIYIYILIGCQIHHRIKNRKFTLQFTYVDFMHDTLAYTLLWHHAFYIVDVPCRCALCVHVRPIDSILNEYIFYLYIYFIELLHQICIQIME